MLLFCSVGELLMHVPVLVFSVLVRGRVSSFHACNVLAAQVPPTQTYWLSSSGELLSHTEPGVSFIFPTCFIFTESRSFQMTHFPWKAGRPVSFSRQIVGSVTSQNHSRWKKACAQILMSLRLNLSNHFQSWGNAAAMVVLKIFPKCLFTEMGRNSEIACILRKSSVLRMLCISESSWVVIVGSLE